MNESYPGDAMNWWWCIIVQIASLLIFSLSAFHQLYPGEQCIQPQPSPPISHINIPPSLVTTAISSPVKSRNLAVYGAQCPWDRLPIPSGTYIKTGPVVLVSMAISSLCKNQFYADIDWKFFVNAWTLEFNWGVLWCIWSELFCGCMEAGNSCTDCPSAGLYTAGGIHWVHWLIMVRSFSIKGEGIIHGSKRPLKLMVRENGRDAWSFDATGI